MAKDLPRYDEDGNILGHNDAPFDLMLDPSGTRLWLNAADGSSIGRFNVRSGVDLHTTVSEQLDGESQCLWCTHEQPDFETWKGFIAKVKEVYGVVIPEDAINTALLRQADQTPG